MGDVAVGEDAARAYARALVELREAGEAMQSAREAAQVAARAAVEAGVSEVVAARAVGVDRHTLRAWLGKGRGRGGKG